MNFVIAMTVKTTPVVIAPTTLMTADRFQFGSSLKRNQCSTIPACESVKHMNTPRAYSGISALVLPWNAMISTAAAPVSRRMPLLWTSR